MRNVHDLLLTSVVILHSIGISSGMPPKTLDLLENFGKSNDKHAHDEGDPRLEPSSSSDMQHLPASHLPSSSYLTNSRHHCLNIPPPHLGIRLPPRSRSPEAMDRSFPNRHPFFNVLDYGHDQLESIRLIPNKNSSRSFKLQRYVFPADKSVLFLKERNLYRPVPNQEHVVLSTIEDDVFAIMRRNSVLAGIYIYSQRTQSKERVKINMRSGEVTALTADEIKETPVGRHRQILYGYTVQHIDSSRPSFPPAQQPMSASSSSPSGPIALPTRLSFSNGSIYGLDQLQYIRLIAMKEPNQIFELQRYIFPVDKPLLIYQGRNSFGPIPFQEFIVLTTLSGDVFAILESNNDLAGIYTYNSSTCAKGRVKINMRSGAVTILTRHEVLEVPVGRLRPISYNFRVQHVDPNYERHRNN